MITCRALRLLCMIGHLAKRESRFLGLLPIEWVNVTGDWCRCEASEGSTRGLPC